MPRRATFDTAAVDLLLAPGRAVASRRELMELGVPGSTITFRCRPEGPWQRILPGVVVGHRGTPTLHERRLAALRYAHPEAALCGLDALVVMGMRVRPGPDGHLVHVLVPDRCHRLSHGFAVVTRTKRLEVAGRHQGMPCVGAARAVVEAVRRMKVLGDVRALVAEAVQTRRCRPEDIAREIEQAARARTALGRAVLREVRAGVRSVAEAELRAALARARGARAPVERHGPPRRRQRRRRRRRAVGAGARGRRGRLDGVAPRAGAVSRDPASATAARRCGVDGAVGGARSRRQGRSPGGGVPSPRC